MLAFIKSKYKNKTYLEKNRPEPWIVEFDFIDHIKDVQKRQKDLTEKTPVNDVLKFFSSVFILNQFKEKKTRSPHWTNIWLPLPSISLSLTWKKAKKAYYKLDWDMQRKVKVVCHKVYGFTMAFFSFRVSVSYYEKLNY